ncbi:MAG: citramalate synthase [Clostridia bacterium]|nr:citramalate synthase [Clostridia bacterium]
MKKIWVYDTTLRDGSQGEGVSLTVEDKLKITARLDLLGVDYVEGGWPGSNPKDMEYFKRVKELKLQHARLAAFGSTRRPGIKPEEDANLQALAASGVPVATIFGKSWDLHVLEAIGTTLEENLRMVGESVKFLKDQGMEVVFDAEHFFDGYKNNPDYALQVLEAALRAGADWLVLCDTNGGSLPAEITKAVQAVSAYFGGVPLGIHCHNDGELAVANSLAAIEAGVTQIQGTINGLGERCGNANLCSVIPNVELKLGYRCLPKGKLKHLTECSRYISEIANLVQHNNQPFVGQSAFAHKGGIHVSAVLKHPETYEHLPPEAVGNTRRILVSELSGASNLMGKAEELGIDFSDKAFTREVIQSIKELEYQGYQFEGAEASLELILKKATGEYAPYFLVDSFKILSEKMAEGATVSEAMVKVTVGDKTVHTAAEGNGPVNALDNALRKGLEEFFPEIAQMHLSDYKVRVLDEKDATAAKVRVLIESRDVTGAWSTVGVSTDIIEASWRALLDSIDYFLMKRIHRKERPAANDA